MQKNNVPKHINISISVDILTQSVLNYINPDIRTFQMTNSALVRLNVRQHCINVEWFYSHSDRRKNNNFQDLHLQFSPHLILKALGFPFA